MDTNSTDTPSVYSGIVSPMSRRLRTIGIVLLTAVCAMALYGYFVVMPSIERSLRDNPLPPPGIVAGSRTTPLRPENPATTRAQRVRKLQIAVALAYWGVCSLLLVSVVLVAWLDFREVTRVYVEQRQVMWTKAVANVEDPQPDDEA